MFSDLQNLRRVVVLFDECEDFIKRRGPSHPSSATRTTTSTRDREALDPGTNRGGAASPSPESRTIGAFITSGMLPRLQSLHDSQWILFAVATNSSLEELDSAAIRPGRFDFTIDMHYPRLAAQLRYLENKREILKIGPTVAWSELTAAAVKAIADRTKDASMQGTDGVPWTLLDDVATYLSKDHDREQVPRYVDLAWAHARRLGPPQLGGA